MILQVHDELVFDIPTEEKDIFTEIVKNSMEQIFLLQTVKNIPDNMKKIPITVDIGYGNDWTEAK